MKTKIKIFLSILVCLAMIPSAFAKEKIYDDDTIAKVLESNTKPEKIIADLSLEGFNYDSYGIITTNIFNGKKFSIQTKVDMAFIRERIQYAERPTYRVEFILATKKPKVYFLTRIYGIETVREYRDRIAEEEAERQRNENKKAGLGNLTDTQAASQRAANLKAGLGEITNEQVRTQRERNKVVGLGEITDYQVEKQIEENEKSGYGKITDEQVKNEKSANKENGLGEITDEQVKNEKSSNKEKGLGEITNQQVQNQKNENYKKGFGSVTDEQVKNQRAANKENGLGEITDEEVENQQEKNRAEGFGKITDEQVKNERAANKENGLGEITDIQVKNQKYYNKRRGLGEITDYQVEKQRAANKANGFGELTDAQADEERIKNEKSGYGKITDFQMRNEKNSNLSSGKGDLTNFQVDEKKNQIKNLKDQIKKYLEEEKYVHLLGTYYDLMKVNPGNESAEILAEYNKISDAIKTGNPGIGTYDEFGLYENWDKLCNEFNEYWTKDKMFSLVISDLKKTGIDYTNKTAEYEINFQLELNKKYSDIREIFVAGYEKFTEKYSSHKKNNFYGSDYSSCRIYFTLVDSNGKNLLNDDEQNIYSEYDTKSICRIENVCADSMKTIDEGKFLVRVNYIVYKNENYLNVLNMISENVDAKKITEVAVRKESVKSFANPSMVKIPEQKYEMMTTEVTQGLYELVMETESDRKLNLPAVNVSWYDAIIFCNKLSVKKGYTPVYSVLGTTDTNLWGSFAGDDVEVNSSANGYRLPTMEEWQFAAKGGKDFEFAGSDTLDEVGWYNGNTKEVCPVGQKKSNDYGLYDMSGNVWEWCWDSYFDGYGPFSSKTSWKAYYCGGSYRESGRDCGVTSKYREWQKDGSIDRGFRIVRNIK